MTDKPLSQDTTDVHLGVIRTELAALVREAVEAAIRSERNRCKIVAKVTKFDNLCRPGMRIGDYIAQQIEATAVQGEPEPQPEEPMTIEKLVERLRQGHCVLPTMYLWSDLEKDLTALVEARTRRDSDLCVSAGFSYRDTVRREAYHECGRLILADAGLKDA